MKRYFFLTLVVVAMIATLFLAVPAAPVKVATASSTAPVAVPTVATTIAFVRSLTPTPYITLTATNRPSATPTVVVAPTTAPTEAPVEVKPTQPPAEPPKDQIKEDPDPRAWYLRASILASQTIGKQVNIAYYGEVTVSSGGKILDGIGDVSVPDRFAISAISGTGRVPSIAGR